jgi:hypothetical protein
MYGLLADLVLIIHLGFVLFVLLGGLLILKWRWIAWTHVPAAAWGIAIEFGGWICPLTPLENHLRERAGEAAYSGDFIARYLLPVIYPEGLTREAQIALGLGALLFNAAIYAVVVRTHLTGRRQ